MEPLRDDQLIAELRALRPAPSPAFAAELDERAAAGFPRRQRGSKPAASLLARIRTRVRATPPRRLLIPAGGVAVLAVAVATAVIAIGGGGGKSTSGPSGYQSGLLSEITPTRPGAAGQASGPRVEAAPTSKGAGAVESSSAEAGGGTASEAESQPVPGPEPAGGLAPRHRDVERAAEITLAADPKDVADDASRVFEAVHAHRGIVMRSSTSQGRAGEAGARFELLIPSDELSEAMAAFSQIDNVRSRHEATADITAPTVSSEELLKESRARIDSLLGQLEEAETESEREAVEAELRHERRHAGRLAAQVAQLHRRADYSRVTLRIVSGEDSSSGGGAWGVGDAFHDAGHILAVAAGVILVALAILGPIALIALLAWLSHRLWVRHQRRRVLS
jgi:hypothetical protein